MRDPDPAEPAGPRGHGPPAAEQATPTGPREDRQQAPPPSSPGPAPDGGWRLMSLRHWRGTLTWTLPNGRTITTTPEPYPV